MNECNCHESSHLLATSSINTGTITLGKSLILCLGEVKLAEINVQYL